MTINKSKSGDCGTFFEIEFTLRRIFCAMPRALLFLIVFDMHIKYLQDQKQYCQRGDQTSSHENVKI